MVRSVFSKVLRVGRATVFMVGISVILALMLGVATAALAHTGSAGLFHLGHSNRVTALSTLTGKVANGLLRVTNQSTASIATAVGANNKSPSSAAVRATNSGGGPALDLRVGSTGVPANDVAPMKVNSDKMVTNLNADKIDGKEASEFLGSEVVVRTVDVSVLATNWGQGRAKCQAGEIALSGGGLMSGSVVGDAIMDSYPINSSFAEAATGDTPAGWDVWAYNAHNQSRTLTTYVVCAAL